MRPPDVRDRFRLAATEHVTIELRAAKQPLGHIANGFEALEPQRQRGGHIRSTLAFGGPGVRQQKPRLQVGEPGRHDQIVRRQLEPELARFLDEGEVLVRERQDRDLCKVDLLRAGKHKQEIERTLKSLDVHHQRRLTRRPVNCKIGLECRSFGGQELALRDPVV